MTPLALRDHAQQIQEAIILDLRTPQTSEEQSEKSLGLRFNSATQAGIRR